MQFLRANYVRYDFGEPFLRYVILAINDKCIFVKSCGRFGIKNVSLREIAMCLKALVYDSIMATVSYLRVFVFKNQFTLFRNKNIGWLKYCYHYLNE